MMKKNKKEITSYTKEDIEKFINEIFKSRSKSERKVKAMTGCKTYGAIILGEQSCSDPDCPSCSMFHKLVAEEAKKFMYDLDDTIKPVMKTITLDNGIEIELIDNDERV